MGWFLRLSCLVIVIFGIWFMWEWVSFYGAGPALAPKPLHRQPESVPAVYRQIRSVPTFPVDHVAQRRAI
jgi:hypothetical protein